MKKWFKAIAILIVVPFLLGAVYVGGRKIISGYKLKITDDATIGGDLTTTGTVQAEQLTSTDDITMLGHLLTLGDSSTTDPVISFTGNSDTGNITWDESPGHFSFDKGIYLPTSTLSIGSYAPQPGIGVCIWKTDIEDGGWRGFYSYPIYTATGDSATDDVIGAMANVVYRNAYDMDTVYGFESIIACQPNPLGNLNELAGFRGEVRIFDRNTDAQAVIKNVYGTNIVFTQLKNVTVSEGLYGLKIGVPNDITSGGKFAASDINAAYGLHIADWSLMDSGLLGGTATNPEAIHSEGGNVYFGGSVSINMVCHDNEVICIDDDVVFN